MVNLRLGMKIYDNAWFLQHRLQPEELADLLVKMGVTFVIAQSRFLPMQDNAVASRVRDEQAADYAALDDLAFRQALAERDIAYFACLNICFDPKFNAEHSELLPIDQFGQAAPMLDWYQGLPPDRALNLEHKIGLLKNAVSELSPDGVHLGFVRWPGFWETWLPDVERAAMPEYCYAPQTLQRFCTAAGIDLPISNASLSAEIIAQRYRAEWRDWKCAATVSAIEQLRAAVLRERPGTLIAINTLPFFQSDFGNAVEEVFGQDIGQLAKVVDIFEVMSYHQILRRGADWPAAIGTDVKTRSGRRVICTLQAKAYYLDGMHAGHQRAAEISADEFGEAVGAIERSPIDGMCVFTLSDLLDVKKTSEGRRKIESLTGFRS